MTHYCFAHTPLIKNYIGIKLHKKSPIVILHDHSKEDRMSKYRLKDYLRDSGYTQVSFKAYKPNNPKETKEMFGMIKVDDLIILPPLTQGKHLSLYQHMPFGQCPMVFINDNGDVYTHTHEGLVPLEDADVNLRVQDFIKKTDGRMIESTSDLFSQPAAQALLAYFVDHLLTMKKILKHKNPMVKKSVDESKIDPWYNPYSIVKLNQLSKEEKHVYLGALNLLASHKVIDIKNNGDTLDVTFNDLGYRDYFAKAGTWLEHLTFKVLVDIEAIKDVNSSVQFIWDENMSAVKNELDVMAVTDNRLIVVSCKDTSHLEDDYLYELESHADRLANEDAVKVLVTTSHPPAYLQDRAKQLDIHLVVYEGNEKAFVESLEGLIN